MSQFPNQYEYDPSDSSQPLRTSGLAITALIFGILAVIPCLGVCGAPVGLLLGLIGVGTISPAKGTKGKGLAVAAVVLSLLGAGVQYWTGRQVYVKFVEPMIELMQNGPEAAMIAGYGGDLAGFKGWFHGTGASASDAEVQTFLVTLEQRYGAFQGASINEQSQQPPSSGFGQTTIVAPYILTFENGAMDADVELVIADQATGQLVWKLGSVTVIDTNLGDVSFPSTTGGALAPPPTDTSNGGDSEGGGDPDSGDDGASDEGG